MPPALDLALSAIAVRPLSSGMYGVEAIKKEHEKSCNKYAERVCVHGLYIQFPQFISRSSVHGPDLGRLRNHGGSHRHSLSCRLCTP